jgi:hypothetical protein
MLYILFFILWLFELFGIFFSSFDDSSNGVVYFVLHLMTVRTVCYVLFFILWQFERCGIFCFLFDKISNGVFFLLMTVRTVCYILFFISWQFERRTIFCFIFDNISNGVLYLPRRWNCHRLKNKTYHTVRTVIKSKS